MTENKIEAACKKRLNTELLEKVRNEKGYSQSDMDRFLIMGRGGYQKWESGEVRAGVLFRAEQISNILEIPLESLITTDGIPFWRKPYVPEEYKDVPDINTTIHNLVERLPEFLKKEAPTPEMLDYMIFKDQYGEGGAILAMVQQTNYGVERCNEIKAEYEDYMSRVPEKLGEGYWLRLSKSWNYKDMGKPMVPIGDIGYHRFLVDSVVSSILSKDNGATKAFIDLDHLITLLMQAKHMKTPFKIGERLERYGDDPLIAYDIYITRHSHEFITYSLNSLQRFLKIYEKEQEVEEKNLTTKEKIMKFFSYKSEEDEIIPEAPLICEGLTQNAYELIDWYYDTHPWLKKDDGKLYTPMDFEDEDDIIEELKEEYCDHIEERKQDKAEIDERFNEFLITKFKKALPLLVSIVFAISLGIITTIIPYNNSIDIKSILMQFASVALAFAGGTAVISEILTLIDGNNKVLQEELRRGLPTFFKIGIVMFLAGLYLYFSTGELRNIMIQAGNALSDTIVEVPTPLTQTESAATIPILLIAFSAALIGAGISEGLLFVMVIVTIVAASPILAILEVCKDRDILTKLKNIWRRKWQHCKSIQKIRKEKAQV